MTAPLRVCDLFCGAGGLTSGLMEALRGSGVQCEVSAVNHWDVAIATHSANHPDVRHWCRDMNGLDPLVVVPEGRLDLLIAAPSCTHHSNARGGRPRSEQMRASAWHILHWADLLKIDRILIENVPEFRSWGALDDDGKPIPAKRGGLYQQFLASLDAMGYAVEHRVLCAADYGDATTRKRLFIQATRRGRPRWPEPTHQATVSRGLLPSGRSPRPAREIIDWSIPGQSIYNRKRPLAENTMRRILAGLRKHSGLSFVLGQQSGSAPRLVDHPIPTVAGAGAISLVEPFLVPNFGERPGQAPRTHGIDDPLPTVTSHGAGALVQPYLVRTAHGADGVESRCYGMERPMPTIAARCSIGVAKPYLLSYYGQGGPRSVDDPLDTITARDRFALVSPDVVAADDPEVVGWLDIRFRMLQPHELAAAMSFDQDYQFTGTREQKVKQIGNSVPVRLSTALCRAALGLEEPAMEAVA